MAQPKQTHNTPFIQQAGSLAGTRCKPNHAPCCYIRPAAPSLQPAFGKCCFHLCIAGIVAGLLVLNLLKYLLNVSTVTRHRSVHFELQTLDV